MVNIVFCILIPTAIDKVGPFAQIFNKKRPTPKSVVVDHANHVAVCRTAFCGRAHIFFFFFWLIEGSFLRRPEGEKLNEAQQVNVCFFFIELEFWKGRAKTKAVGSIFWQLDDFCILQPLSSREW